MQAFFIPYTRIPHPTARYDQYFFLLVRHTRGITAMRGHPEKPVETSEEWYALYRAATYDQFPFKDARAFESVTTTIVRDASREPRTHVRLVEVPSPDPAQALPAGATWLGEEEFVALIQAGDAFASPTLRACMMPLVMGATSSLLLGLPRTLPGQAARAVQGYHSSLNAVCSN